VNIRSIDNYHLWQISVGKFAFTAHIDSEDPEIALKKCTNMLRKKYDIKYVTLQIEDSKNL
jgi:Co/Zn/Cd efflux system component